MKLVQGLLSEWQRLMCSHRWVRARWQDGSYGLRCAECMKAYPHTWEDLIAKVEPQKVAVSRLAGAAPAKQPAFRPAA
ncbi:MAG: hypothetical protein ACRD1L_10280 [Terriglobales bacterium]